MAVASREIYLIQCGEEFVETEFGYKLHFEDAEAIVPQIYENLREMIKTGDKQEVDECLFMVQNLRIIRFWLH
jgi:hypothetical protein